MSDSATPDMVALRPPKQVMRLARMGAMHASRLSFAPTLLRRAASDGWRFDRPVWAVDREGFGHAVYTVTTPHHRYSLVAFSRDLPPEQRTDRVIAEAWDTSYVLYDGVPDAEEIARLAAHAPRQEAGRFTARELVLSRANKSVRLFASVVEALARGEQPDAAMLEEVGYLMRTTAVYGNGKFGIADRDALLGRSDLSGPFQAEMLTVWLIRSFTLDLVDHCAAMQSENAVRLLPALRRRLGVGNSTGLGMAPFLVRHPILLHNWMLARETALARVRAVPVTASTWEAFEVCLSRRRADAEGWMTQDSRQAARILELRSDLGRLAAFADGCRPAERSWDQLYRFSERELGCEAQEMAVSLLLEPHGSLIDDLAAGMEADEAAGHGVDGLMSCGELADRLARDYDWAINLDHADARSAARFWYVSEEKLEPRLGRRPDEPGEERELPLTFARDAARLAARLTLEPADAPIAALVAREPEWRHVVRRVQLVARYPYAEIRDNLVAAELRPIDLLRCKLSFFGASRFDPRSDLWLRIALFQGEPLPDDLCRPSGDSLAA